MKAHRYKLSKCNVPCTWAISWASGRLAEKFICEQHSRNLMYCDSPFKYITEHILFGESLTAICFSSNNMTSIYIGLPQNFLRELMFLRLFLLYFACSFFRLPDVCRGRPLQYTCKCLLCMYPWEIFLSVTICTAIDDMYFVISSERSTHTHKKETDFH